ncbi:MAG TPA: lipase maturation factor family protein, partial [Puia sp.]
KGLPVALDKQPPQVAPYQLRLDWQIWFASMSTADEYPWTLNLVSKLLHNDPGAISLLAGNPFPDKPPRFVRAALYRYSFAKTGNIYGRYWDREMVADDWIPAMSVNDPRLINFLKGYGWMH